MCPFDIDNDIDQDGVCGDIDPCPLDNPDDTDNDGICDSDDICQGYDDLLDSDNDLVPDGCDICPLDNPDDSDGDSVCDTDDICPGYDDFIDNDGDGTPDGCDVCPQDEFDDSDGDGSCDSTDICQGYDDNQDLDMDNVPDGCDPCPADNPDDPDSDGICSTDDPCPDDPLNDDDLDGICYSSDNCPTVTNKNQKDSDEDGIGDVCDDEDNRELVGGWGCNSTSNSSFSVFTLLIVASLVTRRKNLFFLLFMPFLMGAAQPDAQTYSMPLGDIYSTIDSPLMDSKYSLKFGGGYAYDPLFYKSDSGVMEPIVNNLFHGDIRYQHTLGSPKASFLISADTTYELDGITNGIKRPRLSAGISSVSDSGLGGMLSGGTTLPVLNQEQDIGANLTVGLFKEKFGIAASGGVDNLNSDMDFKAKAGAYIGSDNIRATVEWNQTYAEYKPAEALLSLRFAKGRLVLSPAIGVGINNQPATPKLRGLLTISLRQFKKDIEEDPVIKEEEEIEETMIEQDEDDDVLISETPTPSPIDKNQTEDVDSEKETKELPTKKLEKRSNKKPKDQKHNNSNKSKQQNTNTYKGSLVSKDTQNEKEVIMPLPTQTSETNAHELQPSSAVTPESLGQLSAAGAGDSTLTLLLAILAVLGGGAAWKFYSQYSEQKHDQKMKQMEIDAKMQGLAGAQPPPCQAAKLKIEEEIKELKARLNNIDQKMSLNADFDGDLLTRKVKKLERRLKDLEGNEDI
jgi:hypothetical protein